MARPKDINLELAWRQRLRRQSASGLSITAICAREGLSARSFYAWKGRRKARSLSARPEPPLFVPLRESPYHQAEPALGRGVVMELPHQVRLRFDSPPEPEWLGRVVDVPAGLPHQEVTP
jgi:hypothetical protein